MNKIPRVGVGVLIFNENSKILLGKRRDSHGHSSWGPPGGHLEFGESLEQCAIREVFEETRLQISDPQFFCLTNDLFEEEGKHYVSIFMRASSLPNQDVQNAEPHKTDAWEWFAWDKLPPNLFLPLQHMKDGNHYGNGGER